MKKIFFVAMMSLLLTAACHKSGVLPDGIYIAHRLVNTTEPGLGKEEDFVLFDPDFKQDLPDGKIGAVIGIKDWVPFQLGAEPLMVPQPGDKVKLELTLSGGTAGTFENFTSRHIAEEAAIIVGGQVVTVKKIRDTVRGGRMEITGCNEKACERIIAHLRSK